VIARFNRVGNTICGEFLGWSSMGASRFFPPVTGFVGGLLVQRPCRGSQTNNNGRLASSRSAEESLAAREESLERIEESRPGGKVR
jgi:hypothetical protein